MKMEMSDNWTCLVNPAVLEVVLDEHVGDGAQGKPHVVGVGGAGDVEVDFGTLLLHRLELVGDELQTLVVLLGPGVFRKGDRQRLSPQTLLITLKNVSHT